MPRVRVDYRAARALISAPYPLATITTRDDNLDQAHNCIGDVTPTPQPITQQGYGGFPIFNPNWRDIPPAFPPIPYPPSEKRRRPNLKQKNELSRSSEMMSGIEEMVPEGLMDGGQSGGVALSGIGETGLNHIHVPLAEDQPEAVTATPLSNIPLPSFVGRSATPPHAQDITSIPELDHASQRPPISQPVDTTPTQARHPRSGPRPRPFVIPRRNKPIHNSPSPPSSEHPHDASSDGDGEADSEVTVRKVAGSTHRASPAISSRSTARRPSKPLFIGATNLTPFTFAESSRERRIPPDSSASEAGCDSDVRSTRTVIRIPRSRGRRDARKVTETPQKPDVNGKGKQKETPRVKGKSSTNQSKPLDSSSHPPDTDPTTPKASRQVLPPTPLSCESHQGIDHKVSRITPLLSPKPVRLASMQRVPVICPTPYSPTHMSVDPRSAPSASSNTTIHPNSSTFATQQAQPCFNWPQYPTNWNYIQPQPSPMDWHPQTPTTPLAPFPPMQRIYTAGQMPTPDSQPFPQTRAPGHVPTRRGSERSIELPFAKLCQSYLLLRKKQQHQRRKLAMNHRRKVTEKELGGFHSLGLGVEGQITPQRSFPEPDPSTAMPGFQVGIRSVHSIARVDTSKPPRKRRRELSPDSSSEFDNPFRQRRPFDSVHAVQHYPYSIPPGYPPASAQVAGPSNQPAIWFAPNFSNLSMPPYQPSADDNDSVARRLAWIQSQGGLAGNGIGSGM